MHKKTTHHGNLLLKLKGNYRFVTCLRMSPIKDMDKIVTPLYKSTLTEHERYWTCMSISHLVGKLRQYCLNNL